MMFCDTTHRSLNDMLISIADAKAAGDVNGQVAALIYRTLERNTGSVGAQSNPW